MYAKFRLQQWTGKEGLKRGLGDTWEVNFGWWEGSKFRRGLKCLLEVHGEQSLLGV